MIARWVEDVSNARVNLVARELAGHAINSCQVSPGAFMCIGLAESRLSQWNLGSIIERIVIKVKMMYIGAPDAKTAILPLGLSAFQTRVQTTDIP